MENNEQTPPHAGENILNSIQDKVSELKDIASESLESAQKKAEELLDKVKSGELADETKKKVNELSEEAKEKLGDLAEEAKGIWNKLTGNEHSENK